MLLRALKDKWAVPTVASLAVGAALLDPAIIASASPSAGVALAARETLAQREARRQIRRQPFFYLHELRSVLGDR
jgi:hypothetical protein